MVAGWPDQFDKVASAVGLGNTTMSAQTVPSYINVKGIPANNIDPSGRQTGSRAGFTIVIVMASLLGLITTMMFICHGFSFRVTALSLLPINISEKQSQIAEHGLRILVAVHAWLSTRSLLALFICVV
jgi:hypothetical protein